MKLSRVEEQGVDILTVSGPVDEETGFLVDLGFLDGVLQREVRDRFDHRNINVDVPEFGDGKLIPTGEHHSAHPRIKWQLSQLPT